ncbi:MAG: HlyD family efflux transporter periplasmic adaptor subunit [Rickettsiales bacterium]|nr:HlyD family efflux transporter periplasmic adaptor subunit [Rickettsiales bacterium]
MDFRWSFPAASVIGILFMIFYVTNANTTSMVAEPLVMPSIVPFESYLAGAGITEPNTESISIGTNRAGIIKSINASIGQTVSKGEILFVIENSEAEANLEQAKVELKIAQDNYNIIAGIKDKRAVSLEERNQRANNLDLAKAKLKSAEVNLELYNIRSPIDGVLLTSNARVGEFAPAGIVSEPLMRLGNISPMFVRVDIDENDAWRFKNNAQAIAYVRGNNDIKADLQFVRIEPFVRPKKSLTGDSLERVDTRVLQVIYKFEPKEKPIFAGQQMDIYIEEIN